jgi:hypothetical protein
MTFKERTTPRGFPIVEFTDCYGVECSLQASSLANFETPGTSAVWLGPTRPTPKILASEAASHGIETGETSGWVEYPLPPAVEISTRMHLDREQVTALISALQSWLDTGHFADSDD